MGDTPHPSVLPLLQINRRSFLKYVGTGATALATGSLGSLLGCATTEDPATVVASGWTAADGTPLWRSPPYPVPLPGDPHPRSEDAARFAEYEVIDDLVLPDGFRYDVVARWGDRFGPAERPDQQITFGYNNDYTGLLPIAGSDGEYWLLVNHEYLSLRPWLAAQAEEGIELPELRLHFDPERPQFSYGVLSIEGFELEGNRVDLSQTELPEAARRAITWLSDEGLAMQGISVLRVRQRPDRRFEVVRDAADHRRIATQTFENIALDADGRAPFRFTGPAANLFDEPPRGTFCNCSGGTSPWATFLTCEENYHFQSAEEVTPDGQVVPSYRPRFSGNPVRVNGRVDDSIPEPQMISGLGNGASTPLDGRQYGWVCEVDPTTGAMDKHTALGRFRHENVALRVEPGKRLAAYMGDDRRGGHVWKFVSAGTVERVDDPANSRLLESGTLYAAHFKPDYSGEWVALEPETPLRRPEPGACPTEHMMMPARPDGGHVAVGDIDRDHADITVEDWQRSISDFAGKPFDACTLGDLIRSEDAQAGHDEALAVILLDAFAMANAVGGTPTARPEDLEVHPLDRSVYIAFTDATESGDGSPDARIFPDSARENTRQYGAIYRIVEDGPAADGGDPAATTFTWGKFLSSGEVADNGGGFANADNLVFDPQGNLWMVTDISMTSLNFPTTRESEDGSDPGGKQFPGVFGNNAMFMIPTTGPQAGVPHLFAIGPIGCEMCGPTFTDDGRTLILSIQHPGEETATRLAEHPSEVQEFIIHDRDNRPFVQRRTIPTGSNFPSGEYGKAPRPCIVCITRVDEADV